MPCTNVKFYHEILSWFNVSYNTLINLSPEQILIKKYIPGPINRELRNHDEVHDDDVCRLGKDWNENVSFDTKKET